MPISGTTTDYTGRTVDIFISQGINPMTKGVQPVTYGFGRISNYITGVQKLVQRYLISLVNTGVMQQLQSARANNLQEATHIFNFASSSVISQFIAYQNSNPGAPTDEALSTVQLTNITSLNSTLSITIKLINRAGDATLFVLPVPLT